SGSVSIAVPTDRTSSPTSSDCTTARQYWASNGTEPASHHSEGFVAVTRAQTADSSGDKSSGGATIRSGIAVTVASDSDDLRPLCFTANVPRIQNCCDLTHERLGGVPRGTGLEVQTRPPYRVSAPLGSSRRSPSIVVMTLAASSSSVSSASSSASSLASMRRICSATPRMLGVEGKSSCVMALDPPLAPIHLGPCLLAMVASAQTLQVVAAVVVAVAVYVIDVLSRVGLAGPLAHQAQRLFHQDLLPDLLPPLAARV